MSWFTFGNKNNANKDSNNGVLGLTYLEHFTEVIQNPKDLKKFEWRRKLKSSAGNNKFKIKYYGELHNRYNSLIVETDFAPQKLIAIDIHTNEEILLFDGCKHGYDAITWVEFSKEQVEQRRVEETYTDEKGNEIFELIISAYYQIDYESEFCEDVDENGLISLNNGEKIEFEKLKRNWCSYLGIRGINNSGEIVEILSEELS